ncbi:glycyl-tRNA synthetase, tetrameric type, beta subunit [Thiovulum sp. ES]|nr:glycyl-tRNA synthetase, tetrameric type, beta subunit [Thiovulum sp. ES]
MKRENFLIEIGVEEFPAEPLLRELPNIETKWKKELENNSFPADFQLFFTPRRLVLWHRDFPEKQEDREVEFFGAPTAIAFKDGVPTKAFHGFVKKCGVDASKIEKVEKGGKEVLYYKKLEEGKNISELLQQMLDRFMKSLNFGKSMRWGNGEYNFIRPVHSLLTIFGKDNIETEVFGIKSEMKTFGHRNSAEPIIPIEHTGDYFCNLPKYGIMVKQKERELTILEQFKRIEKVENVSIEVDEDLLKEVVAITEEPTSLFGKFDSEFLELPDEVIITSMREHQRYFPVYKDGKLTNHFIVVSNALADSFAGIIAGNERVLKARLSDALFFYKNDLKNGLQTAGLKKITYVDGLGSLADKIRREIRIANILNEEYKFEDFDLIEKAINLSKADLLSEMVYEFTELQGIMGAYYAEKQNESDEVIRAIREQYLPNSDGGDLPSSEFSAFVSFVNKVDTLLGLFSIGENPTGSRDPFGLRRTVNGIIRISLEYNFKFDITEFYNKKVFQNYKGIRLETMREFFFERIYQHYKEINPSIIKSVLKVEDEILEIDKKVKAVAEIVKGENFDENLSTFKRVANILKDETEDFGTVVEEFFEHEAEKKLYQHAKLVVKRGGDYKAKMKNLFSLKHELDEFFDSVMVNAEDIDVRNNRKALLQYINSQFLKIADIKEITGK